MKSRVLTFFFCLFSFFAVAQQLVVDSLTARLRSVGASDPLRVDVLNHLSYKYLGIDYDRALIYADSASRIAVGIGYRRGIAVANNRKANCNWMMGSNEISIDQALFAAGIAEKENLPGILVDSYYLLGVSYTEVDRGRSETYLLKAEKLAIENNDKIFLTKIYAALGVLKSYKDSNDSATAYFDQALKLARESRFDFYVPVIFSNKLNAISRAGQSKPEEIYKKCQEIIDLSVAAENRVGLCLGYMRMAEYYHKYKQYAKSDEFHQKSIAIATEMKLRNILRSNYFSMIALKVEEGDFWGAHGYMKKYYDLKEQLMNEKKSRQIVEMETRYEMEKKEATIKLLEQERRIQNIWKYIWISGSLFVLVVILVIYRLQIQKNEKLRETYQLKSRFFANISHEFRTPLSLILAPIEEQMKNVKGNKAALEQMLLIKRNANRLLDMVNELLDLSKLEGRKMKLSVRNGLMRDFLTVIVSSFESLADRKNIRTITQIDLPAKEYWFDMNKIEKVVSNLLSNAYKFTPADGVIKFTASLSADSKMLSISVSDTGPGISADDQQFLFSPFFQSTNNREIDGRGTGLGLALAKELVELHKGTISLLSTEGRGTTFTITFPVVYEAFAPEELLEEIVTTAEPSDSAPQTMLIVEDNGDLLKFISSVFHGQYAIITASNGRDGLRFALENLPDIIISDIMMPGMDGLTMLQELKNDERVNHIPIVILTARNESDSRMQGFKYGADDYLAKPFSTDELRIRVDNLVKQRKLLAIKYRERFITAATPVTAKSADEVFIKKVVSAIEENLGNPLFSVEKLAEDVNLSRAQLFRKLKALMNISPNQLINDLRLQRASELILSKADTLSQICYRVGFNEPSYFARRFRQKYGVTPSEFADRG